MDQDTVTLEGGVRALVV